MSERDKTPAPQTHLAGYEMSQDSNQAEQRAFLEWAKDRGYDMCERPLHYLFTDAARQGWKAGLAYAREARPEVELPHITDEMIQRGLQHYSEGGCSGLADYERREVVRDIIESALASEVSVNGK